MIFQASNKYCSSKIKLLHTCKDHLQVTTKNCENSQMKQFAHFSLIFAQMKQFCLVLAQIEQLH